MPPKKAAAGPSKKNVEKKKDKVIEDKTFGLKNKKGNKQQRFINTVTAQVKFGNQKDQKKAAELGQKIAKKDAKKKEAEELNMLFRPVMEAQKLAKGVDPKSVLCAFFKQGSCSKGDRCKFSHDLNIERKAEKRSVYGDGKEEELANDTMDNWDDEKLMEVVSKKHGDANESKTKTEIVCRFFIQALENMKYGWFWSCPNGEKCKYKHALPPGFVLKKDKKKMEEQEEDSKISLEELIEDERNKLTGNLTKINLQTFMQWKKRKIAEKVEKLEADQNKKRNELKQGKSLGVTGRELFSFKPEMVGEDDDEGDVFTYKREEEDDEEDPVNVQEVSIEAFAALAMEVDTSSSHITSRLDAPQPAVNGHEDDESGKLDQAAAILPDEEPTLGAIAAAEGALANGGDIDIDEDLFGAECDIELDEIDLDD
ncbi:zinc finger CCCH domain-containing protein 15 [Strongylocentrotus purpuratus]|uniref:Zinc finger CCCH domain-containing protein 15 n=1 Tax=Strongylocentrotus purpuratus TaxID=7668 RepID=A0A7M7N7V9_STRPU|nr:zinc finger CCCH domain-containing protein 15-like [Strongylocentrotus purpuratus]XP_785608.3 zinc finger CCCH domain-containing protein 15 [Strongylocentrotus purpuratus]|eukprot:XP_785608.3 PREDICTED: zinc finger CCCH domain-containing protein 15 [Strongylocentrotus purpuratus]